MSESIACLLKVGSKCCWVGGEGQVAEGLLVEGCLVTLENRMAQRSWEICEPLAKELQTGTGVKMSRS